MMTPAIETPHDALPSLRAPCGSDTTVLLATTAYIHKHVRLRYYTKQHRQLEGHSLERIPLQNLE